MHICRVRGCPKVSPRLMTYNTELKHKETAKYLGLTMDSSMTWRSHLISLKQSTVQTLNLLKVISNNKSGADKMLVTLHLAILKSKLNYGKETYSSASESTLKIVEPIQNAAFRIATGGYRTTPIPSLESETGVKPLLYY